jgi:hypothetical protein
MLTTDHRTGSTASDDQALRDALAPLRGVEPTTDDVAAVLRRAPEAGGRRAGSRRSWAPRVALVATSAAAIAVGVVVASPDSGTVFSPPAAQAAPLTKLTRTLALAPAPSGDATLTIEHRANGDLRTTGYNLVTDDRSLVYYATTRADLRTASASSGTGKATGVGTVSGWIEAAAAGADLTPEQAADAIKDASGIPIVGSIARPNTADEELSAAEQKKLLIDQSSAAAAKPTAEQAKAQRENLVWTTALSTLQLAGGRPDVRAGALKAMSAVGARTTKTVFDGHAALQIVMNVGDDGYEEALTIDADTGVPLHFVGGDPGRAPGTESTYEVTRVSASDLGH